MKNIKAQIKWKSDKVVITKRPFLICFGEKCMSGKIEYLQRVDNNTFKVEISFIEPEYFQKELTVGNQFTINEASKILATGRVDEIDK